MRKRTARRLLPRSLAVAFIVVWGYPIYWMLNTSFKTKSNLLSTVPQFLPHPFTFVNYTDAVTRPGFTHSMVNSIVIALVVTGLSIICGFLASAALARYVFRGRTFALVIVIAVQMVPTTAILIPLFLALERLNLLNTYMGLVLCYLGAALPISIWLLRGFLLSIPDEVTQAAELDGAGPLSVLWWILLPLARPGIITTSVFAFIYSWNDYILAYVMMRNQSDYTFPVWLVAFTSANDIDYGGLIASSVLFTVPTVIFFLLIQRYLVSGLSAGAVKG